MGYWRCNTSQQPSKESTLKGHRPGPTRGPTPCPRSRRGRIRCGKDTGLRSFPFRQFAANQVWLELVLAAQDLLTFFQRLCLDGEARRWEPKRLRYRLLHVAGRVARSGRRVVLRLQRSWPWTAVLAAAFGRLRTLCLKA